MRRHGDGGQKRDVYQAHGSDAGRSAVPVLVAAAVAALGAAAPLWLIHHVSSLL